MWRIFEHKSLSKQLKKTPIEILKRYEKWKDIVRLSGPSGLKQIKGFHDESLTGKWKGFRSSRLGIQFRVIYQVNKQDVYVTVEKLSPHDYKRD